jgi:hypothetical protein
MELWLSFWERRYGVLAENSSVVGGRCFACDFVVSFASTTHGVSCCTCGALVSLCLFKINCRWLNLPRAAAHSSRKQYLHNVANDAIGSVFPVWAHDIQEWKEAILAVPTTTQIGSLFFSQATVSDTKSAALSATIHGWLGPDIGTPFDRQNNHPLQVPNQ